MDFTNLKSQIAAISLIKSGKGGSDNELWVLIGSILLVTGVEFFLKQFQGFGPKLMDYLWKTPANNPLIVPSHQNLIKDKEDLYTVTLVRRYDDDNRGQIHEMVEKVDAVIEHLSNLEATKHVLLDERYTIGSDGNIIINDELTAEVKQDPKGAWIEIVLFSDSLMVTEIRKWIDEVHEDYIYEKSNRLGQKTFYFNEIPIEPPRDTTFIREEGANPNEIRWRFDSAPKQLTFTMNEFNTSKSFANVYGSHVDELRERLNIFINYPEWYEERGIPHTLGVMLHGIPGAGKTSTIKAVAKDTNRHIFNLSLRPYTTCKQLTNLFYDENVTVSNSDGSIQNYRIPLNKRVYVIEDIDCLTDVVLDRGTVVNQKQNHNEVLTLSFLLNLLDGVLETPGRILIITSNYPERIDKALIRPGRIDVKVEFRRADRQFILDMLNNFYECEKSIDNIPESIVDVFTPAEVMESMCMHFKDPDAAIQSLITRRELINGPSIVASTSLNTIFTITDSSSDSSPQPMTPNGYGNCIPKDIILPPTTPKPTIKVDSVNLTGSDSCPWAAQRLHKTVPAESFHKHFNDNSLGTNIPFSVIDCMRLLSSFELQDKQFTRAQLIEMYGEENVKLLEKHREESNKCMKRMTNEIKDEPEAVNCAEDNYVGCGEDIPPFNLPEETQKELDAKFAKMTIERLRAGQEKDADIDRISKKTPKRKGNKTNPRNVLQ